MSWRARDERVSDLYFVLDESPGPPSVEGQVRLYSGDVVGYIGGEVKSLTGGLTADEHRALRQLIHFIDEGPAAGFASGAYKQIVGSKVFPTAIIWWESTSMSQKIVEKLIDRTASNTKPNPITWKIYDTDGTTVLWTLVDEIQWSGPFEVARLRSLFQGNLISLRVEETVFAVDGVTIVHV